MVTFGGLTKHFLMVLIEYFSIFYTITKFDFGRDSEVGEDKMKIKKATVVLCH